MKSKLFLVLIILAAFMLSACDKFRDPNTTYGSGVMASETRPLGSFSGVKMNLSGEVTIVQGDAESILIEAEDNILPLITTDIHGGELEISMKSGSINTRKGMKFTVTVKEISSIELNGSANITAEKMTGNDLSITNNGSGNTVVQEARTDNRISISIKGSGDITLQTGAALEQTLEIMGSGDIDTGGVECQSVSARILGSGNLKLWVTGSLDVEINGSGEVNYYGSPAVVKSGMGSGKVTSLGNK